MTSMQGCTAPYVCPESVYVGDGLPWHQFQLFDQVTGVPVDFTLMPSPEVTLSIKALGGSVTLFVRTMTLEEPSTGWVSYKFSPTDFSGQPPGQYEGWVTVNTGDVVWTAQNRLRYCLLNPLPDIPPIAVVLSEYGLVLS